MTKSVRQRLDELMAEPPVADLGYPPDQRVMAAVVLGLQLLADSIDAMEERIQKGDVLPDQPEPVGTLRGSRPRSRASRRRSARWRSSSKKPQRTGRP
jgi:hypothetical protein